MCYVLCAVFPKWWTSFPHWYLGLEIRSWGLQMCRKWGISSQITVSNACCYSRPWHGPSAESEARSWLLMTQSPPLPFPASWKLQQASVHPQGFLPWEIASKSYSPLSEWMPSSCFLPFLPKLPGACHGPFPPPQFETLPVLLQLTWSPLEGKTAAEEEASCFSEQHPVRNPLQNAVLSLPPFSCTVHVKLLQCWLQGKESDYTFPMDGPDLVWKQKERDMAKLIRSAVLLEAVPVRSFLLICFSLSLSHSCVGNPRLLCPGFSLNSKCLLPEVSNSPIMYKF